MQFSPKQKKFLILLIIPIFCMLYMHFLFIKWNSIQDIFDIIPSYLLFGFSVGVIISALPFEKPVTVTAVSTIPIPLICYIFEIFLISMLSIEANAGGPGEEIHLEFTETLILMALGGLPLGVVAILGCLVGLGVRNFVVKNYLKSNLEKSPVVELKADNLAARATIIVGIATCLTSIVVALLK